MMHKTTGGGLPIAGVRLVSAVVISVLLIPTIGAPDALAQGAARGRSQQGPPASASPTAGVSAPPYVRRTPPSDPVIQQMWLEGTQRSQAMTFAQQLMDSIGSRLTASPGMELAQHWLLELYRKWGITAGHEQYGTWSSWRQGVSHLDLITPHVRSLEVSLTAWSPGTNNKWVEGEVVTIPSWVTSPVSFKSWAPSARGKYVMVTAPQLSCRMSTQWQAFGANVSRAENDTAQAALTYSYEARINAAGGRATISDSLKRAGALGLLSSDWSGYPGTNRIFGSPMQRLPAMEVGCEDYGLLYRLAENHQQPVVRMVADVEFRGELPVYNVVAEIRGVEKPDEYVMMSAHIDSWSGSSGATDNGTGTVAVLEAMRIIKAAYPRPKRTIIAGHWSGGEQGLNGSRGYVEDHRDMLPGLQALFDHDNGTGRVSTIAPGPFANARPVLERYLGEIPREISQWLRIGEASAGPAVGEGDYTAFQCARAPAFGLDAVSWEDGTTAVHTNRDTYDKVVEYDLKNNAMLLAMLAYLASEDPEHMPREVLPLVDPATKRPQPWPACPKATRSTRLNW